MSKELTKKQLKYCDERIKGKTQRQAYKAAFNPPNTKDKDIDSNACQLEHTTKIQQRLEYLRSLDNDKSIANRNDIAKDLFIMASDPDKSDTIRLKAYDQLAKIIGAYDSSLQVNIAGGILTGKDKAEAIKDYLNSLKE